MGVDKRFDELITVERFEKLLADGQTELLQEELSGFHPADIADFLERLSPEQATEAFALLPDFEASEVLDEANSTLTAELISRVDDDRLADLLETLPMDDAAELLEDLPEAYSERLLGLMEAEEEREVRAILGYPEDSAGRLMTQDVAALRGLWTVGQALDYLRALKDTETFHYLYVVDAVGRLMGVVPVRNLLLAQAETIIEEISLEIVGAVSAETDKEELAEVASKYDFTAIPVVDNKNRLLGVVTIDDVIDILEEEHTEDVQLLGGSSPLENPYFSVSIRTMVQKRIGWLILLFLASFLSAYVLGSFGKLLATFAILTQFIPLITSTGGNAGSQTVATVIRAIAVGEVQLQDLGRAIRREALVGSVMGVCLSVFGMVYAFALGAGFQIALVIALTLPAVVVWSTLTATIIPILAERWDKIDATVVSAPMITTIVDATGLLIFLGLASLLL